MFEERIIDALNTNNLEKFRVNITTPVVLLNEIFDYGVLHYMIKYHLDAPIEFYKSLLELESCDINKSIPIIDGENRETYTDLPILLIHWDRKELLELFLNNPRIDLSKKDVNNRCIINKAIDLNNKDVLNFIIENADINMKGIVLSEHTAPLNYAMNKNIELFDFLIKNPIVNINKTSIFSPIQYSIESNNVEVFKKLVDKGADTILSLRYKLGMNSGSDANSSSEEDSYVNSKRLSIVTLFEYIMLTNKREMFEYLLGKGIKIDSNLKNIYIYNIIHPFYVETLLNKIDMFKDEYLPYLKKIVGKIKDRYIHLAFDKLIEGHTSGALVNLSKIKNMIYERCIKKRDLELYKKCVKLGLNDGNNDEYLLSFIELLKVEDIDYLKEIQQKENYNFINVLDRIKFSESVNREKKVEDFIEIIVGPIDIAYNLSSKTIEELLIYEKTIKKLIPHLNYEDSKNGVNLFNKICDITGYFDNGSSIEYPHISNLLRYIIDNSDFCDKYGKYNLDDVLHQLQFKSELWGYVLSKTELNYVTKRQVELINSSIWHLYYDDTEAFYKFFKELSYLKFDNLEVVIDIKPFLKVMKEQEGLEGYDLIVNGFIENHSGFIKMYGKEIIELEFRLNQNLFFKHYPIITSLKEISIDLLELYLIEKKNYLYDEDDEIYNITYTLEHLDHDQFEIINKLLDYNNINVQNFFGAIILDEKCPKEILKKIINHSKFEPYETSTFNETSYTPLLWIIDAIHRSESGKQIIFKDERVENLIEVLEYFMNHDKVVELNGLCIDGFSLMNAINSTSELEFGFFKMDENYYPGTHHIFHVLSHALQQILKHRKFTYNLDNSVLLKIAGVECNSIDFIKYILSKSEIDYNNGSLHAIISERREQSNNEIVELTKMFLSLERFNVNALNLYGRTVLHEAILSRNDEISTILLENPSLDLTITNRKGKNYIQLARKAGRTKIFEILQARGLIDDKKERLLKLELEYLEKMKNEGRILRTRIRDIIGTFELILKEPVERGENTTMYQKTICPFCLIYVEKENTTDCIYIKHQCPHEIRNEELMKKYLGNSRINEGFELCVTCGRPGLNHGHLVFNQSIEGRQLEAIQQGGHSWVCDELVGGGSRIEIISRITIILTYIKNQFEKGEKLVYDKSLIKTLTDLVDSVLSTQGDERDKIFQRAREILERSKFDQNSKIPPYAKFNASNEERREIEAELEMERVLEERRKGKMVAVSEDPEAPQRTIEAIKVIQNDGSLLCIVCGEPILILYQAHIDDIYYICSDDLQGYVSNLKPGGSMSCILGCNNSKKKVDARGILIPGQNNDISGYDRFRNMKQIYRDEVEKLDDGEFFSRDYSSQESINIAQPSQMLEDTIKNFKESVYQQDGASSSGINSEEAGPSNLALAIVNALTKK